MCEGRVWWHAYPHGACTGHMRTPCCLPCCLPAHRCQPRCPNRPPEHRACAALQGALLRMDDSALTVEQLQALSRVVPDDTERNELELYLSGEHPKHKWVPWRRA